MSNCFTLLMSACFLLFLFVFPLFFRCIVHIAIICPMCSVLPCIVYCITSNLLYTVSQYCFNTVLLIIPFIFYFLSPCLYVLHFLVSIALYTLLVFAAVQRFDPEERRFINKFLILILILSFQSGPDRLGLAVTSDGQVTLKQ